MVKSNTVYITVAAKQSLAISISQSGTTLYWNISGLTAGGSFTVTESTSQGFTDSFSGTASSSGTSSSAFNYGGGTAGDVVSLTVKDMTTGATASTSYTVQATQAPLSASISQTSGSYPAWSISGLTPGGGFVVDVYAGGTLTNIFSETASSSGTSSSAFNPNASPGVSLYIVVSDSTTYTSTKSNTITLQSYP